MQSAGLIPPADIEADGKLRRFSSNGKRGDASGWYSLHGDSIPAGSFGDWRTGLSQSWRADIGRALSPQEETAHRAKIEAIRREREAEESRRHEVARHQAESIWRAAEPAIDHPYLTKKGVKSHGLRVDDTGRLIVPMRDGGVIHSLQFIGSESEKLFLPGGRGKGCYFGIGKPESAKALCIAEGFATGASIHEATGHPVAVAFCANNLKAVAIALRQKFPDLTLILCADDDSRTRGNPGLTKATDAARSVGGLIALPDFGTERPEGATDFNDMAQHCGAEAVKRAVASLASSGIGVTGVTRVQANNDGLCAVTPAETAGVTGVTTKPVSTFPEVTERPVFGVFDDAMKHGDAKFKPGVWYFAADKEKNPTQTWICSPLHVEAVTFDGQDNNFGRLLRFKNTLGTWREWAMPMELLRGAGDDLRGELLAMGVEIDPTPKARNLLATYLQATPPNRRMRCALQVGWCDDSFVLPDTVIGPKASAVIFQSGERGRDEHTQGGTLAGWQSEIAALAIVNPLLTLALSASFAGPLLALCNAESGGLHFVGDSSTGKTTIIEAACATWGGPNFRRSWRATANGMEGAAALFNDCLLALDEISECEPKEIGAIVYALGNGRGKQRASRTGNARSVTRWRCVVLSSGERTIGTVMAEGGYRSKAGQAVRLLDIPAARAFGAWDNLHGLHSGAAFADALKKSAATHYGHAGRAFLEKLTRDTRNFSDSLERIKALPDFAANDGEGQDKRAAGRFALMAFAGELATEYGLTGWGQGDAIKAAAESFKAWRSMRGRGNDERRQILEQVSGFIERHGDARFSDADANANGEIQIQIRDRAGWWRDSSAGRVYLFTSGGMREAVKGFDFKRALDAVQEAGALPAPGADGKRGTPERIKARGAGTIRLYTIFSNKLGADDGA